MSCNLKQEQSCSLADLEQQPKPKKTLARQQQMEQGDEASSVNKESPEQ